MIGSSGDDRAINANLGDDGRIWVTGYTGSGDPQRWDMFVVATDDQGCFINGAKVFDSGKDDYGTVVQPLPDGDLLLAGYSNSFGKPDADADAFVMRMATPAMQESRLVNRLDCQPDGAGKLEHLQH